MRAATLTWKPAAARVAPPGGAVITRAAGTRAGILLFLMLLPATAPSQSASTIEHKPSPHVYLADSVARGAVERAVRGATERLNRPGCQRIFTDFADGSGLPLRVALEESTRSAVEYLVERVWFVDGGDDRQCRADAVTVAYTAAGNHVIRICAGRFAERFTRETRAGEIVIIHELLHTLGLGENPPKSSDITKQVTARCGG
jgi:hypothetical protein